MMDLMNTYALAQTNVLGHNIVLLDKQFPVFLRNIRSLTQWCITKIPDEQNPQLHYCKNLSDSHNHKKSCIHFNISLKQFFRFVCHLCN
jgi:hypothetical protein